MAKWHGPYGVQPVERDDPWSDPEFRPVIDALALVAAVAESLPAEVQHFRVSPRYDVCEIAPGEITMLWSV